MRVLIAVDDSVHSRRAVQFVSHMRWPAGSSMMVVNVMPALVALSKTTLYGRNRERSGGET